MTHTDYDPPLSGVRVLDLVAGPMLGVSRILADLGAEVCRVDLNGVSQPVPFGPLIDGVEIAAALATFGMGSVSIDLSSDGGQQQWEDLLATAGILIESTTPGSAEEVALNVEAIRVSHPHLVVLSISDFGRDTRYSHWKGSSPVFHALTSELSRTGDPGREPLLPPGELPYETATAHAVLMTLAVYLDRLRSGLGERIDFSILGGAAATLDPAFGMAGSAAMGESLASLPRGRTDEGYKYPIIPCVDGYARICVLAKRQWQGLFEWMGRPEQFADPKYDDIFARFSSPDLIPAIARFFADKTRAEIEDEGQRYGVPAAAVLSVQEALRTPQVIAREFLREIEFAPGLTAPVPVGIMEVDRVRASALNAPHQPNANRLAEATHQRTSTPAEGLPLAGLKVVDFGIIIVGGDSTRILADLGADVIRVENSAFPDGARASLPPGEMKPGFASGHRNKRSVSINLQDPDGLQLAYQLIRDADIVFSNWKPGTKEKLGLDFGSLKNVNPGIVVVDSSAFGPTGPWAQRLGYGPLVRAATGFTQQWVYADAPGRFQDDITVYPDHVSARISDILALALLVRRARTGLGGEGSNSQAEVMMSHMIPGLVAESLTSAGHTLTPGDDAPWGVFPAKGDDDWIVVTVRNDGEWRGLARMIDRKDLLVNPDLATAAGRRAQRDLLHEAVAAWTRTITASDGMELLQAAGVPAGAMLRGAELPEWDFYRKRRTYRVEAHPFASERFTLENVQIHGERIAEPPRLPAPMLGEHTIEIARDVLGLSPVEIADLLDRGVLEDSILPAQV